MVLEDIIAVILLLIIIYLFGSGLLRIIRRKGVAHRWKYAGGHYAIREDTQLTSSRAILSGIIRIIIAGILFFIFSNYIS